MPTVRTAYLSQLIAGAPAASVAPNAGPRRLLVIADRAVVGVADVVRQRVPGLDRVAVCGTGSRAVSPGATAVRHFATDWAGARAWLLEPLPHA